MLFSLMIIELGCSEQVYLLDIFLEYSMDSNISVCCGASKASSQSTSGPGRFFCADFTGDTSL